METVSKFVYHVSVTPTKVEAPAQRALAHLSPNTRGIESYEAPGDPIHTQSLTKLMPANGDAGNHRDRIPFLGPHIAAGTETKQE